MSVKRCSAFTLVPSLVFPLDQIRPTLWNILIENYVVRSVILTVHYEVYLFFNATIKMITVCFIFVAIVSNM